LQDLDGQYIPAINELRYTSRHILRSLTAQNVAEQAEQIRRAISHCQRASYDTLDMSVLLGK